MTLKLKNQIEKISKIENIPGNPVLNNSARTSILKNQKCSKLDIFAGINLKVLIFYSFDFYVKKIYFQTLFNDH